jgi:neutral ceramidase
MLSRIFLVLGCFICFRANLGAEPSTTFQAGVARADLTPPLEMKAALGGYGARMSKPAVGVHDRVWAKALVMVKGNQKFALVTADVLAFPPQFKSALLKRLSAKGWAMDDVMLLPSHSHTSIDMMALHPGNTFNSPPVGIFQQALFEHTLKQLDQAISEAGSRLTPALAATKTTTIANRNRNRRKDSTVTDPALTVTRIDSRDGKPLAALINWTAHPTFMDESDMLFSGDWPGQLQRTLESLIGTNVTAMFYNGAEGDQSPTPPPNGGSNWERAESYGRDLGIQGWRLWTEIQPREVRAFDFHTAVIRLPERIWHPDFMKTGGAEYGLTEQTIRGFVNQLVPEQTRSTCLRLADLIILGVPGELATEFGLEAKKRAREITGVPAITIGGLANEWISYILTPEEYRQGGYEASMSFYGETLGTVIIDGVTAAVRGLNAEGSNRQPNQLPSGLSLVPGAVNGVIINRLGKSLAIYGYPSGEQSVPDLLLLTHARRDVTWAAETLARRGAPVVAPERESDSLTHPEQFWDNLREKRFHDYAQQTTRMPVNPIPVSRTVKPGDTVNWADLNFRVIDTPGYTRSAVSYVVNFDGKKVAFTGDLIRDDGKLQDLFSLQDAIPDAKIGGYHGWAGRLGDLMTSLDRMAAEEPDLLVPCRGPIIHDPSAAIGRLKARIRAAYSNYLSIDALRWYFKDDHMRAKANRVLGTNAQIDWMPMGETLPLPEFIIPISNSRLILSSNHAGFLVDCGGTGIIEELRKLRSAGKLKSLDHVFVTHYHDDHTDALPALVSEFGSRVHACGSLIDLIERPGDYRLPCLTKNPTAVTAKHHDHETWLWAEYQLTIYDYPGQTLHHNALSVEGPHGWSAFFVGDSFTPSGIDDYCLQNRNFLHPGQGFFKCLDLLEQLPKDCLLLNEHVEPAFRFTPAQVARMREILARRISLLTDLFPYDDPNFGLDDSWAELHPYWIKLRSGASAPLTLRITNHSPHPGTFRAAIQTPKQIQVGPTAPIRVATQADGYSQTTVAVAPNCPPGLYVITADVGQMDFELRQWTEAVIEVEP